jgi:hypothetical protein
MAEYKLTAVEGTTTGLQFQLLQVGIPINLTGANVSLTLTGSDGVDVNSPAIAITDTLNGKVTYTPLAGDLSSMRSPYAARFKVVSSNGAVQFVPSGYRDEWNVTTA